MKKILLIEDDARIRSEVIQALRKDSFDTEVAPDLKCAREMLAQKFEVILVDLGLPDGDGLTLCREIREAGMSTPILVVTARDEVEQKVLSLDAGADDYLVKPFHMAELSARIRSLLRRPGYKGNAGHVSLGPLEVDPAIRVARRGGSPLDLRRREFDLLHFLVRHPGRVWTREQLLAQVWTQGFDGDSRTVDIHIRRLRQKVEQDPGRPRFILTEFGVGYRMASEG